MFPTNTLMQVLNHSCLMTLLVHCNKCSTFLIGTKHYMLIGRKSSKIVKFACMTWLPLIFCDYRNTKAQFVTRENQNHALLIPLQEFQRSVWNSLPGALYCRLVQYKIAWFWLTPLRKLMPLYCLIDLQDQYKDSNQGCHIFSFEYVDSLFTLNKIDILYSVYLNFCWNKL